MKAWELRAQPAEGGIEKGFGIEEIGIAEAGEEHADPHFKAEVQLGGASFEAGEKGWKRREGTLEDFGGRVAFLGQGIALFFILEAIG